MQITIGKYENLNFEMHGTIGPAFVVEQMTGEDFNAWGRTEKDAEGNIIEVKPNPMHNVLLLLVILQFSNPEYKEELNIDWLLENLTTPIVRTLSAYVVKRWAELEGWKKGEEEAKEDDGKKE